MSKGNTMEKKEVFLINSTGTTEHHIPHTHKNLNTNLTPFTKKLSQNGS